MQRSVFSFGRIIGINTEILHGTRRLHHLLAAAEISTITSRLFPLAFLDSRRYGPCVPPGFSGKLKL